MTLTLTLTPERETRLQQQARTAGLPLEEYALRVLDGDAAPPRTDGDAAPPRTDGDAAPPAPRLSPEERIARFQAWAESHGHDTPLLTDEAISREAIYSWPPPCSPTAGPTS